MFESNQKIQSKLPYKESPTITIINLERDEVMAVGCKNGSATGAGDSSCLVTGCDSCGS